MRARKGDPSFGAVVISRVCSDSPKTRGLKLSTGGKANVGESRSTAASLARGPSGCMLSAVLVVSDKAISLVLNENVLGASCFRKAFENGVGLRDWKCR